MGLVGSSPQCWGSWVSTLGSVFPLEKPQAQGSLSVWALCHPGEGQCDPSETAPLSLLMWSFSVSVVQGLFFSLTPRFWDFHTSVLPMGSCYCSWSSCEED